MDLTYLQENRDVVWERTIEHLQISMIALLLALPIALLLATVSYVLVQRLMDGGSKLSHAGRDEPDDELIEL